MKLIPLTQEKLAIVDDDDFEYLNQWKWFYHRDVKSNNGYALRNYQLENGKRTTIRMHKEILKVSKGIEVDHKNGNGIDNRKENLRPASRQQNCANRKLFKNNTSQLKGAYWRKDSKCWRGLIRVMGKSITLGNFETKEDAHSAYLKAAQFYFGEFTNTGSNVDKSNGKTNPVPKGDT